MQTLLEQIKDIGIMDCDGRSLECFDALTQLGESFANSERVQSEAARFEANDKRQTIKQFLVKYQERQEFTPDHPLYAAGLELYPIAQQILGPCQYISADLWYALPNGISRPRAWSQCWHRDPEADQVLKVMLFLREVDEEAGPFEYIARSHKNYFDVCPAKTYLKCGLEGVTVMRVTCPAGTLVFANTAGLHRGGYTKSKARLSCVWTYVPVGADCRCKFSLN